MRTTVTLEPDTEALVCKAMRERGLPFKEVVNEAVRDGLTGRVRFGRFTTPTFRLGRPTVPLTKALSLAGQTEDEEIVRKLGVRE